MIFGHEPLLSQRVVTEDLWHRFVIGATAGATAAEEADAMSDQVPERALQIRSLVTEARTVEVSLAEANVPAPEPHEVLVRVEAAPINPSDLGLMFAGADLARGTASGHP